MIVLKVVDEDIADKVDIQYIQNQFANLENIGILYVCTLEGGEEDDWIDADGMRNIIIHLPYKEVKKRSDIRSLMLAKAEERLGLVSLN
ncbi:MAG: hypothetical protein IPK76_14380 [Lewinellaceae bacterium]|nr:hypothetical protein [Lewinellaceae bacterium]